MNITIEIANETLMQLAKACEMCNITFMEQLKNEIVLGLVKKAVLVNGITIAIAVGLLATGWFLAGWYKRMNKQKEVEKNGKTKNKMDEK